MNIRAYHLLRNNKEEGPFTREEIIGKNLKPYDLIWIDGRSAAWSYPGELAEFKLYAPLPVEENQNQNKNIVSASVKAAIAVNNTIADTGKKEKPRYKVYAAWNKIPTNDVPSNKPPMVSESQRAALKNNSTSNDNHLKSLSWKEAWLDWEHEKITTNKDDADDELAENKTAKNNQASTPPLLEKKFEQPLNALKEQYIENVLRQKQQKGKNLFAGNLTRFIVPTLALAVIFSISYWLLHDYGATAKTFIQSHSQQQKITPAINVPANVSTDEKVLTATSEKSNFSNTVVAKNNDRAEERKPVEHLTTTNNQKNISKSKTSDASLKNDVANSSSATKTGQEKNIQDSPEHQKAEITGVNAEQDNQALQQTKANEGNANAINATIITPAIVKKPEVKKTVSDYISTPEYIAMKNGTANIKIQNISDVNLDLVVIDVQYYDASHNYRKGETLYLHNLKAGKNIVIKTPKDDDAFFATTKVSLVSSDTGNVNVIGDN